MLLVRSMMSTRSSGVATVAGTSYTEVADRPIVDVGMPATPAKKLSTVFVMLTVIWLSSGAVPGVATTPDV